MPSSSFMTRVYHSLSPKHRRAAKQRRKEYQARFEELQRENESRIQRISELRGDTDTADFLYDSAWGTGAARSRHSIHEMNLTRSASTLHAHRALTASSTGSSSYASSTFSSRRSTTAATSPLPNVGASLYARDDPPAYEMARPQTSAASSRRHSTMITTTEQWYLPIHDIRPQQDSAAVRVFRRGLSRDDRELRMSAMMA